MEELEQLITDCKSGKRDAQSKLYRLYAPQLFALCIRYSRDRSEAEDCLHEGFVTIFEKIGQYAGKGSFEGWMKRIVINLALEKYRVRYRLHTVEDMKPYEMQMETSEFLSELNAQQLLELIAELPPRYKMVFNMYAIDGYSHKEIAEEMGITEGTSKSNLARARKILQDKVKQLEMRDRSYAK